MLRHGPAASAEGRTRAKLAAAGAGNTLAHWNTVYLERAVRRLRAQDAMIPEDPCPCRPARVGVQRADRRLRLDRSRSSRFVPPSMRCPHYVPALDVPSGSVPRPPLGAQRPRPRPRVASLFAAGSRGPHAALRTLPNERALELGGGAEHLQGEQSLRAGRVDRILEAAEE